MTLPAYLAAFYPMVMAAAILVGAGLLARSGRTSKLSRNEKIAVGIGAFCGGMIGAKVPFLFNDWSRLLSGEVWFTDGKTILTGLVGAYFGVELAKWTVGVKTRTGDSLIVPAAVAIAVGRLSCFVGGCCFGAPTTLPWGFVFPKHDPDLLPRHPTQLYEAAFHLCAACVLAHLRQRGIFRGQLAKLYIISYCVYRFITEFIRPEPRLFGEMTFYQWTSMLLIPLFAAMWGMSVRAMRREATELGQAA